MCPRTSFKPQGGNMHIRVRSTLVIVAVTAVMVASAPGTAAGAPDPTDQGSPSYQVRGPQTSDDVNAVARTGAAIDGVEHGRVQITATAAEVKQIRKLGFRVELVPAPADSGGVSAQAFPPADSGYHDYNEMVAEI